MRFADRSDAGRQLAGRLAELHLPEPVVLALPRGGVPVGLEVARRLRCRLDLVLVRKIGAPGHEELAAGALVDGERPELVLNAESCAATASTRHGSTGSRTLQLAEIERRRRALPRRPRRARPSRAGPRSWSTTGSPPAPPSGPRCARCAGPAPRSWCWPFRWRRPSVLARLATEADRIVCVHAPRDLMAVGQFYRDFRQVEDAEVVAMLESGRAAPT